MKTLMIIDVHSLVDVITNSSTELFILDTNKSVTLVTEILQDMYNVYLKANDLEPSSIFTVANIYIADQNHEAQLVDDWGGFYNTSDITGKIIIEGIEDNIIPYGLFDFIEYTFNARRLHLG